MKTQIWKRADVLKAFGVSGEDSRALSMRDRPLEEKEKEFYKRVVRPWLRKIKAK